MGGWQTTTKVERPTCYCGNRTWHDIKTDLNITNGAHGETEIYAFICARQIEVYMSITAGGT